MRSIFAAVAITLSVLAGPALADNLVANADFDTDLSGWTTTIGGFSINASAALDMSFGNPAPGSAVLTAPFPPTTVRLAQCLPIHAPLFVDLTANTYTDSSSGTSTNAVEIESFDADDCAGTLLETQATTDAVYTVWGFRSLTRHPLPDLTASVRVSLYIDTGNSSETVHFDHIVVIEHVFDDGFEG